MSGMNQEPEARRSNIARPISRLPMARASTTQTTVHQDDHPTRVQLPRTNTGSVRKQAVKPLGESNNISARSLFGWGKPRTNGVVSPTTTAPKGINASLLERSPPSKDTENAVTDTGDENASAFDHDRHTAIKAEKRKPRLSLSERTVETLSQISPAPSPTRRRSSTVKSGGSMGPPLRPASAMRHSRPNTPSTPSSGRAPSPTKRAFRPPGKPVTPAKGVSASPAPALDTIYTPPRAFMRDHASRIGKPARSDRRSISTALSHDKPENIERPNLKPSGQAAKVKSMYDLRAAASRTLTSKPSMPNMHKGPSTPRPVERKPSLRDASPQATLMKARSPGENVIATCSKPTKHVPKPAPRKVARPAPTSNQSQKREVAPADATKSSAALRDTIAKAKAARREELRNSAVGAETAESEWSAFDVPPVEPMIMMGSQSLKKKLDGAVTSGILNLSTMSLAEFPVEVLNMYDYKEDSTVTWSEAVDLRKFLIADNDLKVLPDSAFPDFSEQEMTDDPDKSNQFGGLETLDVHGNALTAIPVGIRRLQQLRVLNLSANNFDMSVFETICELQGLKELRMSKTGLCGALPDGVGRLEGLQVLDLSENQIDVLPASISRLKSLQKLLLGGNSLSALSASDLPGDSLTELDMSRNALTGTFSENELASFAKLQMLNLAMNSLRSVCNGALTLPSLQTIAIDSNRLNSLPDLSICCSLTTLTASDNSIMEIDPTFYTLMSLRNADLSNNGIKSIDAEVMKMDSLVTLNLGGNPLREKKYLTMNFDEIKTDIARKTAVNQTTSIKANDQERVDQYVENNSNTVESGPAIIKPKAGTLDLSSSGIANVDMSALDLSSPVHTIRLANNDLTTFPIELLTHSSVKWSLRALDMSHNPLLHPIEYLSTEVYLPVLQSLYIVSTGLTTLDTLTTFLKAPELKELNISCHRLTGHVPWVRAWYPSMTTLLASDNWFESIDVEGVRGLEVLDVRNNEIEVLPPRLGLLGNHVNKSESGRLRSFECAGNKFRVPRLVVIERGTEATLRDLRRMIAAADVPEEWAMEI